MNNLDAGRIVLQVPEAAGKTKSEIKISEDKSAFILILSCFDRRSWETSQESSCSGAFTAMS